MAQSFSVPSRAYPAGTTPFGPFTLSAGASKLQMSLLRTGWPDSGGVMIIFIEAVVSFDGGTTWTGELGVNPSMAFGTAGGPLPPDKFGNPQNSNIYTTSSTTPCLIKGQVTLSIPLTTTITIATS